MAATPRKTTTGKTAAGSKKPSNKGAARSGSAKAGSDQRGERKAETSGKSAPKAARKSGAAGSKKSDRVKASAPAKAGAAKAASGSKAKSTVKSGAAGKNSAAGAKKPSAAKSGGSVGSKAGTSKSEPASAGSKAAGPKSRSGEGRAATKASGSSSGKSSRAESPGKAQKGVIGRVVEAVGNLIPGGERNVLDLLKEDHRRVDAHFQKVKAAEDGNHKATFNKIKEELDLHAHVEEAIFYPRLLEVGSEELKKIVREGVEEHVQVKTLLSDLSKLSGGDKVFKAKLQVLIENVEHHVEEEENEMFPLVEDELEDEALVELGDRIDKEKEKAGRRKPTKGSKSGKKS